MNLSQIVVTRTADGGYVIITFNGKTVEEKIDVEGPIALMHLFCMALYHLKAL